MKSHLSDDTISNLLLILLLNSYPADSVSYDFLAVRCFGSVWFFIFCINMTLMFALMMFHFSAIDSSNILLLLLLNSDIADIDDLVTNVYFALCYRTFLVQHWSWCYFHFLRCSLIQCVIPLLIIQLFNLSSLLCFLLYYLSLP